MKKLFILTSSLLIAFHALSFKPPKIDEHLLQTFAVQFPHAQQVVWQELEDSYVVTFIEDRIRMRIVYLRTGDITHYLRYYLEETLPLDIRLALKTKFPGKNIFGITEENIISNVENRTKTVYYIKLEDESSWTTVKAQRHRKLKVIERLVKSI